jgi:hypothetical protein
MITPFRIPIIVAETDGVARRRRPVRIGVPLPRGLLTDAAQAAVVDAAGASVPQQLQGLALWPDRSIKWLLLDMLVDVGAGQRTTLFVVPARGATALRAPSVRVQGRNNGFEIDTGVLRFEVGAGKEALLGLIATSGQLPLQDAGVRLQLRRRGRSHTAAVERVTIEQSGPLRACVQVEGSFTRALGVPLNFRASFVAYAASGCVELELTLHNPRPARHPGGLWDLGDAGSLRFEDLSLEFTPVTPVRSLRWYERPESGWRQSDASSWSLYQDSSGGEQWDCDNHITPKGGLSVRFCGYEVRSANAGEMTSGLRATPAAEIQTGEGAIAATVLGFWENFPKALRWQNGTLGVGLFPGECCAGFELQGGEQKRHTVLLEFRAPAQDSSLPQRQVPLAVTLDPSWVEQTGAISHFSPATHDGNAAYLAYIQTIVEGPKSFDARREIIDEYGWRNFGDLYADHEAVRQTDGKPFISHYNNQYDFIYGALLHYLRSADPRWWWLGADAARHTIDIDIYHTDDDRPAFNHGLFWHTDHHKPALTATHRTYSRGNGPSAAYGGGPSNEHNYTTGLLHYFYLSGDAQAAMAVRELADWVIAMDDGAGTLLGVVDDGPTGLASKTVDLDYHKAGRGAGNSINALLDAYQVTRERRYLEKADELVRRCIHPADDIDALRLREPEHRWSYLVFLQALAKYLDVKLEWGETGYMFQYARASLLHYAQWMLRHEVPYKDVLDKVELPTETWPAHDVRKCHVLHMAAKYAPTGERAALHERADFFFERSVTDILSFPTAYLTRPLIILCVHGASHAYFQAHAATGVDVPCPDYVFGSPVIFRAQRLRLADAVLGKLRALTIGISRAALEAWSALTRGLGDNR